MRRFVSTFKTKYIQNLILRVEHVITKRNVLEGKNVMKKDEAIYLSDENSDLWL